MSILIKGMKMPENCTLCPIITWYDGDGDYVCPFSGISALNIGRQDDCPLIEVPADVQPLKHGRWIQLTQNVEPTALKCSLCGEISCCRGMYCPDCGARMDGK